MNQNIVTLAFLTIPIVLGGIIASINSDQINNIAENGESWIRAKHERVTLNKGWFSRYFLNPLLWTIVKFCDWTDSFTHRGLKNGSRVAATLYLFLLWLILLYSVVIAVVAIVIAILALYFIAKILGGSSGESESTSTTSYSSRRGNVAEDNRREADVMDHVGLKGKKVYEGTTWFNEELKGRVDDEGNLYKGTTWLNEEKIGRIDEEGNIYKGTTWSNEEKVGRIDEDGTLYKGTNWFNEEKSGRIDEDGNIHEGTNWFTEEKRGRTGE